MASELFFERESGGENAVLVNIQFPDSEDFEYEREEFKLLAESAGAKIIHLFSNKRKLPQVKYFIGKGKAEEIRQLIASNEADLVIFNHELTPAQERNLEEIFECRVLDRIGLILDIFADRAKSHEGKLQVELAQLKHLSSRLIRGWSHLERQKGGIGLRGPGETQLESDRRMIGTRIKQINRKLSKVKSTRALGRKARKKAGLPTVSLVGYTNSGKSTLFNALTGSSVYAADQLFATLDATLRKLNVSKHVDVILADTVGFVSRLPHDLTDAFKSTLEETLQADLLLHVIDAASDNHRGQKHKVCEVLHDIGASEIPIIEVMNKIDLLGQFKPRVDYQGEATAQKIWLSAQTATGLDLLIGALDKVFQTQRLHCCIKLSPKDGDIRSVLYEKADIINESYDSRGFCNLELRLEKTVLDTIHP